MIEVLGALESNALSVWIREFPSVFGFPFILFLHTLGLAMVAGVSIAIDLVAPARPTLAARGCDSSASRARCGSGSASTRSRAPRCCSPIRPRRSRTGCSTRRWRSSCSASTRRAHQPRAFAARLRRRGLGTVRGPTLGRGVAARLGGHDRHRQTVAYTHSVLFARRADMTLPQLIAWLTSTPVNTSSWTIAGHGPSARACTSAGWR